jgi:hypothetical protein
MQRVLTDRNANERADASLQLPRDCCVDWDLKAFVFPAIVVLGASVCSAASYLSGRGVVVISFLTVEAEAVLYRFTSQLYLTALPFESVGGT